MTPPPTTTTTRAPRQYEYRVLTVPRTASRWEVRALLAEKAEYGRWELAETILYFGGARRITLRRRIIRVQRSD